ncbi:hypothetical protein PGT21_007408 [Puccinia graminis f. sp. tritici]|uniref:Uncharacterized protein n=2 Tax=Puccinia graminis f. sp. tritici TaxID=56615 RepID=E3KA43_PUCGT|nr:uncharacterized protein PGTG_07277 [Puccinia graminis f. sp. tritici CRL 75-36-700-3]EFP81025.1 hypothetical protein PGTG_07277 [Puccinia graminis f. sp. tritici CRL 75-36-700-3]KAA1068972.1 hypothetical protein PGT21_007408 [Puccinia graminis f. sp. tritici]
MDNLYTPDEPPPEHTSHYHDPTGFQPLYSRLNHQNTGVWSETAGTQQSQHPVPGELNHTRYGHTPVNQQGGNFSVAPVNLGTRTAASVPRGPALGQGRLTHTASETYSHHANTGIQSGHYEARTQAPQSNTGIQSGNYEASTQAPHLQQQSVQFTQGTPATTFRPDLQINDPHTAPLPPVVDPALPPVHPPAATIRPATGVGRTRKPKRSPEEMRIAQVVAAEKRARRFQMQAEKAADARQKQATNAANKLIKAQKAASATPRPTWNEEQTLELLNYVRMVKEDHSQTRVTGGFIPFGKYFAAYTGREDAFPLLESISTATRLAKYRAVMDKWKRVKDVVDRSGAGGLSSALEAGGVSLEVWDLILDMHGDNPAATGDGLTSSYADYESLLQEEVISETSEVDGSSFSDDAGADSPPATPAASKGRQTKYQRLCAGLTPAELALDADSDSGSDLPEELVRRPEATVPSASTPVGPTTVHTVQAAVGTPASTPGGARKGSKGKAKSSTSKALISRPPAEGGSVPRRRGRTEEKAKEEDHAGTGMLVMMHKAQEASAAWAAEDRQQRMEERTRQDTLRSEERQERQAELRSLERLQGQELQAAAKRAEEKEAERAEAVRQADEDRHLLRQQARLDRELADHQMQMDRQAAQLRATEAAEDRKREREEAVARKAEERKREDEREERAERQQQSRQLFEMAMLKAMGLSIALPDGSPRAGGSGGQGP